MKSPSLPISAAVAFLLATAAANAEDPNVDILSPYDRITFQHIKAHRDPAPDVVATHRQPLRSHLGPVAGRNAIGALMAARQHDPGFKAVYQNISALGPYGTQYSVDVTWDDVEIPMIFDTGSSDTWAVPKDFRCTGMRGGTDYPQESCGFGEPKISGFKYGQIPDIHFSLSYGSGEQISGPMGESDIAVAGITVERVQVGLANTTFWYGNNVTQGLLGLAYPALTSAYTGDLDEDRPAFAIPYQPFFWRMTQQGLSRDVFSVALTRNTSDGLVAWGGRTGLPTTGPSASTGIVVAHINEDKVDSAWSRSYYTILVDGVQWDQSTEMTEFFYIVDTGTTLCYLPGPIVEAIAASFSPPAIYLYTWGAYFVPCHAASPKLAFIIGGKKFWINPVDLIYHSLVDDLTGYCQIGVTTGGQVGPYILGMVFLQNVEAVFDVGAAEMRFYGREFYGPTPNLPSTPGDEG